MCVLTCLIIIFPSEITAVVNERGCVRCAAVLLVFKCRAITSLEGVNKMMVVGISRNTNNTGSTCADRYCQIKNSFSKLFRFAYTDHSNYNQIYKKLRTSILLIFPLVQINSAVINNLPTQSKYDV